MKILFLEAAQNYGGARIATLKLAQVASKQHEVTVTDIYGSCQQFVEAGLNSGIKFEVLMPNSNPHFIRSANSIFQKYKNILSLIPHSFRAGRFLSDYIEKNKFDFVCVSGFRTLSFFFFKKPKTKVIFFAHGWYLGRQLSFRERVLLRSNVQRIACISQATKQSLFNNGIANLEHLFVVHNCINEVDTIMKPAIIDNPKNGIILLHCAGFTKDKGQHISLEIARQLRREGVIFKLIFTGIIYQGVESKSYYNSLEKYVKEYSLEDDVAFIVGRSNVYDYIKACDVLLHPSETEGFPLVVMEAQIMKKPVIANAVGGVIDMILDNYTGFLPNHNCIEEYVSTIKQLSTDKQLYSFISENAYKLAQNCFNSTRQEMELNRLFEE